jgi:hypothetical protein
MTKLGTPNAKKITEPVYYCEKHGVLNISTQAKSKTSGAMKHSEWLRSD